MSRPREDHVPTREAACRLHGPVEQRGYPVYRTNAAGDVVTYIKWTCPDCNRERQAALRAARSAA